MSEKLTATNRRLAKVAVQCPVDTFVHTESSLLRMKFSGGNRHQRKARNRKRSL